MPFELNIRDFLGKNVKADPLDHDQHEAQTLDSFEVSTKPGALVKRKGYTDQAGVTLPASYPSGWTIKNIFQFRVTKPTTQNIMMVHATVSGENRVYVDYTYDGSSWVQGWVELTEQEESLTADAGTNTTTIVDAGLSSSTNDYYNGWYAFNWTRGEGALISDYVGSTKTITLKTAVTGQTTGDEYCVYRFPLIVQYEGTYSADTGSSTTQVIDLDNPTTEFYELPQDFDNSYAGWIIENTSQSDTQSVTSFEAVYGNNSQWLVHPAITGQTDGDSYLLYKKTRSISVDDKINFRQRPNTCIMATGNTARYPKQYPFWYSYIRKTYYFGQTGNSINAGFYMEPATLDAPDDTVFTCSAVAGNIGVSGTPVYVACAYVYDGYQVGPMTSLERAQSQAVTSTDGNDDVRVALNVGYSAAPNMRHSKVLCKRVTAVNIYASTDLDFGSKSATWFKISSIPIREDFMTSSIPGYRNVKRAGNESEPTGGRRDWNRRGIITPGGGRTIIREPRSTTVRSWSGSDPYTRNFDIDSSAWSGKSQFYTLDSGGMGGDRVNYAWGDDTINHTVIGKLFLDDAEPSVMSASPLKIDGTPSPDYFPLLNLLDEANNGITEIYNVKIVGDYVYIFGNTKSLRKLMNSNLAPTFKTDTEYEFLGTESSYGIVKFRNRIFGVFKRGIYILDSNENYISYPIEDTSNYPIGVTTLSEAYAAYNPLRSEFYVLFTTDQKVYTWDMARKQWAIHSLGHGLNSLIVGEDGEMFAASSTKIYRMDNGTTDDSTAINPQWKSKIYGMGTAEAVLKEAKITYKSDTVLQFDAYLNRGSAMSWNTSTDNQLAVSATATTKRLQFPAGTRGFELEFGVSIPSASRATNTDVEVYEIQVVGDVEERIS